MLGHFIFYFQLAFIFWFYHRFRSCALPLNLQIAFFHIIWICNASRCHLLSRSPCTPFLCRTRRQCSAQSHAKQKNGLTITNREGEAKEKPGCGRGGKRAMRRGPSRDRFGGWLEGGRGAGSLGPRAPRLLSLSGPPPPVNPSAGQIAC